MSTTTTTTKKEKDSRLSEDASFHSLSLICSFLSETPQDAILRFGPVCRRWHDVMTTQCRDMWSKLYSENVRSLRSTKKGFSKDNYFSFIQFASFSLLHGTSPLSRSLIEKTNLAVLPLHITAKINDEEEAKTRRINRFLRLLSTSAAPNFEFKRSNKKNCSDSFRNQAILEIECLLLQKRNRSTYSEKTSSRIKK